MLKQFLKVLIWNSFTEIDAIYVITVTVNARNEGMYK